jgi:hypothetical protein
LYQFYYILTIFLQGVMTFDENAGEWLCEFGPLCCRIKEQYIYFICVLKYWHFLFVFISSLFIISKNYERRQQYFVSVSFIFQNFLILFILNLALSIQWLKWLLVRWLDFVYFWFFCNTGDSFWGLLSNELITLIYAVSLI